MGIPVTTPITKLIPKTCAQKRAARLYSGLPVRRYIVFKITISGASPIVSCGNR